MLAPAVNHILLGPPCQPGKGPTPRGRPNADYLLPAPFTWLNCPPPYPEKPESVLDPDPSLGDRAAHVFYTCSET